MFVSVSVCLSVCLCVCLRLNAEYRQLVQQRDTLVNRLQYTAASQNYLEAVVAAAEDFREVREIIGRYATLVSTHQVSILLYDDEC